MIDLIIPYIDQVSPRAIPPYQEFLKAQTVFVRKKFQLYSTSLGHESAGIKLLRYILQQVDWDYLNMKTNNYERYTDHLRFVHKDIAYIVDPIVQGKGVYKKFIEPNNFSTEEFIIPVQDINNLIQLPLHSDDWLDWKNVNPLRIWSHDSTEFTLKLLFDRIDFDIPPVQAIIPLNIIALIYKYRVWYNFQKINEPDQEIVQHIPEQFFLHKYVMTQWVYDLTNIWLLHLIEKVMTIEESELKLLTSSNLTTDQQYGRVVDQCQKGCRELHRLFTDVQKNLDPDSLLNSKLLLSGSLRQRALYTETHLPLPSLRQYEGLKWLRDKQLLTLCVRIQKLRPELASTKRMIVNLKRDMDRKLRARPWNTLRNMVLRYQVEQEMVEFTENVL